MNFQRMLCPCFALLLIMMACCANADAPITTPPVLANAVPPASVIPSLENIQAQRFYSWFFLLGESDPSELRALILQIRAHRPGFEILA